MYGEYHEYAKLEQQKIEAHQHSEILRPATARFSTVAQNAQQLSPLQGEDHVESM